MKKVIIALFATSILTINGCSTKIMYEGKVYTQEQYCKENPNIQSKITLRSLEKNGVLLNYDDGRKDESLRGIFLKTATINNTAKDGFIEYKIDNATKYEIEEKCNIKLPDGINYLQTKYVDHIMSPENTSQGHCNSYSFSQDKKSLNTALLKEIHTKFNETELFMAEITNLLTNEIIYRKSSILTNEVNYLTSNKKRNFCLKNGKINYE